jgi:hypothetical protein
VHEVHPDLTNETSINAIHCSVTFSDSDYNQGVQQALVERAARKAALLASESELLCPVWPDTPIWSFIAEENVYINRCVQMNLLSDANLVRLIAVSGVGADVNPLLIRRAITAYALSMLIMNLPRSVHSRTGLTRIIL